MKIGDVSIGPGHRTLVIGELGLNHNGSVDRALEMVRALAAAGCDAVKAQGFTASEFVNGEETYTYLERNGVGGFRRVTEIQRDMFQRCALAADELVILAKETHRLGMLFGVTATDAGWVHALAPHVDFFKVGSDDITHTPLLRILATTGKPVILSTGMADAEEIDAAMAVPGLMVAAILHCVSEYPTPIGHANLGRMDSIAALGECGGYAVPVGYSDHTEGVVVAAMAMARGAAVLEKHFTLDKKLPGPDHWFSMDASEMKTLCTYAKMAHSAIGTGAIEPSDAEMKMRTVARRSIVAARDIQPGEAITEAMLAFRRPGTGLRPSDAERYVGSFVRVPIKAGEQILAGMILPGALSIPRPRHFDILTHSTGYKH